MSTEIDILIQQLADELAELKLSTSAGEYSLLEMFANQLNTIRMAASQHAALAALIAAQAPVPSLIPEDRVPDNISVEALQAAHAMPEAEGTFIFCNQTECWASFHSKCMGPGNVASDAREAGWTATDDLSVTRCPLHPDAPDGGVPAMVVAGPPSGYPGIAADEPDDWSPEPGTDFAAVRELCLT